LDFFRWNENLEFEKIWRIVVVRWEGRPWPGLRARNGKRKVTAGWVM
jgi:hypothetical protein